MSEKKDPHQKIRPVDFDEDDEIIDLTDEVSAKSQGDDEIIDLQGSGIAVPQKPAEVAKKTDKIEPESDDEDDIIYLDGTLETASQAEEGFIDLDEEVGDDESTMGEDEMIASAIVESLGTDDYDLQENRIRLTDDSDTTTEQDDDIIILNGEEEDSAAISNHAGTVTENDEEIFDNEEEIKLEYESDQDEYDLFSLNDIEDMEELETIAMDDEDPDAIVDEDIFFDPVDSVGLSSDEDHEIITMDDEDQEDDLSAADNHIAEARDDIIAGAIENSRTPTEESALIDEAMVPEFEFTEDSDIMAGDDEQAAEDDLDAHTLEEIRELAEENALPEIDDDMDLEFEDDEGKSGIDDANDREPEDDILPFEVLDDSAVEEEDDIIEITEFDEHFSEEDEKLFESTGVLNASDPDDDDFLELIEVEEDDPVDDEEVVDFSNSDELIDEDEINSFFSETLEDQPVFENDEIEPAEQSGELSADLATAGAPKTDDTEEFDFRFGSSETSDQVDQLNSFLSEDSTPDPEVASLHKGPPADKETGEGVRSAVEDTPASLPLTPDQIDSILERVIQDKFGEKIENIIYEVIEKAVSKEIDRLKGALLDDSSPGDDD